MIRDNLKKLQSVTNEDIKRFSVSFNRDPKNLLKKEI